MASSDVNLQLKNVWGQFCADVNILQAPEFGTSILRKVFITESRRSGVNRDIQEALASHMTQSIHTPDLHYDCMKGVAASDRAYSGYILKALNLSKEDAGGVE